MRLSKKEQKRYSRLIAAKLTKLLVKDEIQMVKSGKRVRRPVLDEKGQLQQDSNGIIKTEVVDILRASNTFRNTIRNLRKASVDQIEAFLAIPEPQAK